MTASGLIEELAERELAQREDKDHVITLLWSLHNGQNEITLIVTTPQGIMYTLDIDPKMAWHAYTHAGAYLPEAWWQ